MRLTGVAWTTLLLLAGCATPARLPVYPALSPEASSEILVARAAAVRTVEAACTVILQDAGGDRAVLDGALVAREPGRLRLRAWKFGTTVFDLTLVPEGLWVLEDDRVPAGDPSAGLSAADIARAWSVFHGGFFAEGPTLVEATAGTLEYAGAPDADGISVRCVVDRPTLTPRRYVVADAEGHARSTLDLDRYRPLDDAVWPHRLQLAGDRGRITIEMTDVTLNEEPAPYAFDPPRRAVRRP